MSKGSSHGWNRIAVYCVLSIHLLKQVKHFHYLLPLLFSLTLVFYGLNGPLQLNVWPFPSGKVMMHWFALGSSWQSKRLSDKFGSAGMSEAIIIGVMCGEWSFIVFDFCQKKHFSIIYKQEWISNVHQPYSFFSSLEKESESKQDSLLRRRTIVNYFYRYLYIPSFSSFSNTFYLF